LKFLRKIVPPHGTTQRRKIYIKQLLKTVKFNIVARQSLNFWHTGGLCFDGLCATSGISRYIRFEIYTSDVIRTLFGPYQNLEFANIGERNGISIDLV